MTINKLREELTEMVELSTKLRGGWFTVLEHFLFMKARNAHRAIVTVYGSVVDDEGFKVSGVMDTLTGILDTMGLAYNYPSKEVIVVSDNGEVVGGIMLFPTPDHRSVRLYLPKVVGDVIIEKLSTRYDTEEPANINRIYPDSKDRMLRKRRVNVSVGSVVKSTSTLYPYLDSQPGELWDEFKNSNGNVILLIGEPGCGKSSYIREILKHRGWDDKIYLADQDEVLLHNDLPTYLRNLDSGSVLVTEDSDRLVAKREDGNTLMSSLLNATSGLVSTDTKLIISTNLTSLKYVDPALLRPGRMFKVLQFKKLTIEEAHAVRRIMELDPVYFGSLSEVTLAEALNWHEIGSIVNVNNKIGF